MRMGLRLRLRLRLRSHSHRRPVPLTFGSVAAAVGAYAGGCCCWEERHPSQVGARVGVGPYRAGNRLPPRRRVGVPDPHHRCPYGVGVVVGEGLRHHHHWGTGTAEGGGIVGASYCLGGRAAALCCCWCCRVGVARLPFPSSPAGKAVAVLLSLPQVGDHGEEEEEGMRGCLLLYSPGEQSRVSASAAAAAERMAWVGKASHPPLA